MQNILLPHFPPCFKNVLPSPIRIHSNSGFFIISVMCFEMGRGSVKVYKNRQKSRALQGGHNPLLLHPFFHSPPSIVGSYVVFFTAYNSFFIYVFHLFFFVSSFTYILKKKRKKN